MKTKTLFSAIAYVAIFLFIQTVIQLAVWLAEAVINQDTSIQLSAIDTIIAMALFTVVTIVLFAWQKWAPLKRDFIKTRPWTIIFWCFIASLGAIIPSAYLQELMPEWPDSIQRSIEQQGKLILQIMNTPGGYAVICLLAPIAEEMVFRGAALRKLLEWQPKHRWLMIFLSALFFALAHMNPAQFIHPLLIGLLLGWMYERTGSIVPGIIYHWANNSAAYLMTRAYQDPDITISQIFGSQQHTLMAVGFSLLIFIPAIYQLNLWMKKH